MEADKREHAGVLKMFYLDLSGCYNKVHLHKNLFIYISQTGNVSYITIKSKLKYQEKKEFQDGSCLRGIGTYNRRMEDFGEGDSKKINTRRDCVMIENLRKNANGLKI